MEGYSFVHRSGAKSLMAGASQCVPAGGRVNGRIRETASDRRNALNVDSGNKLASLCIQRSDWTCT